MTNLNEISYVDWQLKFNSIGEVAEGVDDINQCIAIILLTRKGAVPHRPTFGSDVYKYIDYPINEAIPNIIREATDAITIWETRIEISSIKAVIDKTNLKIKIEWSLKESTESGTAEVNYDKAA